LPRLAIRDFLPTQPFGLSAIGEAATLAARRDLSPKAAPVCQSPNSDSSTKSSTYKAVETVFQQEKRMAINVLLILLVLVVAYLFYAVINPEKF
jgi:K+-transporting ATPase KdpF subunit